VGRNGRNPDVKADPSELQQSTADVSAVLSSQHGGDAAILVAVVLPTGEWAYSFNGPPVTMLGVVQVADEKLRATLGLR
jgi:hypothetical protein